MNKCNCKFCGNHAPNNMQGYCQVCYKYFVTQGKKVYEPASYGEVRYAENGDCVCNICGKAFRKLGGHLFQAHGLTTDEAFKKFGWHRFSTRASNKAYRVHMKEIQHEKCITVNLIEKGIETRFKRKGE